MYLKNSVIEEVVGEELRIAGVSDCDNITQKIMDRLTYMQREIALQGSKKSQGKRKTVNWKKVDAQLEAGIDQTTIAASQKVSVSTLQKLLKERKNEG